MDRLDESSGTAIASNLLSEQDLAALASTCRFWRDVVSPDNAALWTALLHARFGPDAAAPPAAPECRSASGPPAEATPQSALYRQLACRVQPVAQLEKIVWLNGEYLQRARAEGSTFGEAIRVRQVCWLELAGRWRGVLPGRYRAVWRVQLEPYFYLDAASLVVRLEPGAGRASPAACVGAGDGQEQQLGEGSSRRVTYDMLAGLADQAGHGWFNVAGEPFEVARLCDVAVRWEALSGHWKRGLLLDAVRLVREEPRPSPREQRQQRRGGMLAAAQQAAGRLVGAAAGLQHS